MAEETTAQQQPLAIKMQFIKDMSFENPNAPMIYPMMSGKAPQLDIQVDVSPTQLSDTAYEVVLNVRGSAKVEDKTAFMVELDYGGIVTLAEGLEPQIVDLLLMVETPRYLFPFARNIVADITRDGGFPPLIMNPIDFHQMFLQRRNEEAAQQANGAMAADKTTETA
ncbi:protein-export chaperone SecB [Kiloniella laminariae]|uniref:Protein-export protein SecB n=1 Tax=Kiloniella laminariae TaxID=454162 RepID=A0ABT4LJQ6_9PROT|nr:protein-export chaperone SecB [Kiloniella laminariae]MCZ4281190.1 protein-export chaperone SecB [Kiloniella laminariae]